MERNGKSSNTPPPHVWRCTRRLSDKVRRLKHIEDTIKLIFLCLKKITLQKYFILIDKIKGEPKKKWKCICNPLLDKDSKGFAAYF